MSYARIIGTGRAFPEQVYDNNYFSNYLDTSDEWILSRTGISKRHIATEHDSCTTLGTSASLQAIEMAGIQASEIDHIVVATCTPQYAFPSVASLLQKELKAVNATALDVNAACSGYIYALSVANSFILSGQAKTVLLVGVDLLSRYIDYEDRGTCILFGDGAGATLLTASETPDHGAILGIHTQSIGEQWHLLTCQGGGSHKLLTPEYIQNKQYTLHMEGKEVFKMAVNRMAESCATVLQRNHLEKQHIDWVIPHQANLRIINSLAQKLDVSSDKVAITIQDYANTVAATIPTTLDMYVRDGKIKSGQHILFTAFGAGLTFGSALIRW